MTRTSFTSICRGLIAFSILIPPSAPTWTNVYGETINLMVVDSALTELMSAPATTQEALLSGKSEPEDFRKEIKKYSCLWHALGLWVSLLFEAYAQENNLQKRLEQLMDLVTYRLKGDAEAIVQDYVRKGRARRRSCSRRSPSAPGQFCGRRCRSTMSNCIVSSPSTRGKSGASRPPNEDSPRRSSSYGRSTGERSYRLSIVCCAKGMRKLHQRHHHCARARRARHETHPGQPGWVGASIVLLSKIL